MNSDTASALTRYIEFETAWRREELKHARLALRVQAAATLLATWIDPTGGGHAIDNNKVDVPMALATSLEWADALIALAEGEKP